MADNPAMEPAVTTEDQPTVDPKVTESLIGQFENLITAENELPTSEGEQDAKAQPDAPSDEPTPQDLELYSIKINGQEEKVNLNELKNGYSRQKDYSAKTNQLADERRGLEAERTKTQTEMQAVKEERDKYATQIQSFLKQDKEENIDWDKAYNEDPIEYSRIEKKKFDNKQKQNLNQ